MTERRPHTCRPYILGGRLGCMACQDAEREIMRAYREKIEAEQERQRIERESLRCDALPSELAVGCE